MNSDVLIAQLIIGSLTVGVVGVTFLPFGATTASIQACQLNTDQRLLKYGGVAIAVMTALSAILFLEVMKLNGILSGQQLS